MEILWDKNGRMVLNLNRAGTRFVRYVNNKAERISLGGKFVAVKFWERDGKGIVPHVRRGGKVCPVPEKWEILN